jgi:2-polyprenyl-3-methyl-5-hydroxy-6-metoxy-1,4-benzoquinol methylase
VSSDIQRETTVQKSVLQATDEAQAYWDQIYENSTYSREIDYRMQNALDCARTFFGVTRGRRLLDLGCGAGATSIYWASTGAEVTSIDRSASAIAALGQLCEKNKITNIHPVVGDAMTIDHLGQFDCVFGAMILHHLEPFGEFAAAMRRTISPSGKAFFLENNANEILVWFRSNIVGKYGVPKYGDKDEFPLTPEEIDKLREFFNVEVEVPEMLFFELASKYLFKWRFASVMKATDKFLYRHNLARRYSYLQHLMLDKLPT